MTGRTRATREGELVPMEVSLDRIRDVAFRAKLHGYHPDDVDAFIEGVARAVQTVEDRLREAIERADRSEALVARLERVLEGFEQLQSQTGADHARPRADRLAAIEARVRAREERIRQILAPAGQSPAELREALVAKQQAAGAALSLIGSRRATAPVTEPDPEPVVVAPESPVTAEAPVVPEPPLVAQPPVAPPTAGPVWEPTVSAH